MFSSLYCESLLDTLVLIVFNSLVLKEPFDSSFLRVETGIFCALRGFLVLAGFHRLCFKLSVEKEGIV